ncbi:MAG: hypothetical protein ACI4C1_06285 [Lachnospiraceae bacterium]
MNNSIQFLQEAYHVLSNLENEESREHQLRSDLKKAEKKLDNIKKAMTDEIAQTTKNKYDKLANKFDKQISSTQATLKQLRQQKDSTKKSKKEDRIQEKIAPYLTTEEQLKTQLKQLFDKDRVPKICRTSLFYLLFMPTNIAGWFLDLLIITLCFFLIPLGIAWIFPLQNILLSAIISFICFLIFGGIYLFLDHTLKENHLQALKDGRQFLISISANRKQIKKITHSILRDDNEEQDEEVKQHNYEIAKKEAELEQLTINKKEALDAFNAATKKIIQDEIESHYTGNIKEHQTVIDTLNGQLKNCEYEQSELHRILSEHYEPYIDSEFLTLSKLNALLSILKNNEASNISDAITIYRNSNKN